MPNNNITTNRKTKPNDNFVFKRTLILIKNYFETFLEFIYCRKITERHCEKISVALCQEMFRSNLIYKGKQAIFLKLDCHSPFHAQSHAMGFAMTSNTYFCSINYQLTQYHHINIRCSEFI